jgi:hypothetical protein
VLQLLARKVKAFSSRQLQQPVGVLCCWYEAVMLQGLQTCRAELHEGVAEPFPLSSLVLPLQCHHSSLDGC